MCLDDNSLKDIWISLYENELSAKIKGVDSQIVGPFMLVERAVLAFKELGLNYVSTLQEACVIKNDLASATNELKILKEKLNETQKPCENCGVLAKELSFAKKRANDAEFRVSQIANILVLRSSDTVEDTGNPTSPIKSSKRKRACLRDQDDNDDADTNVSSQTVEVGCSSPSPDRNKDQDGRRQKPLPKKSSSPKKSGSPIKKIVNNKLKGLSRSTEYEGVLLKKNSPRRNLSADFESISPSKRHRRSDCQSNKLPNDQEDKIQTIVKGTNDSFTEYSKRCGSQLDQLWFGDDDVFVGTKNKNKENNQAIENIQSTSKAKTKEPERKVENGKFERANRTLRSDKMVKKNSDNSYDLIFEKKVPKKKFKQLTLQMRPTNTQNTEVESDPDDIVQPSPDKFQMMGGEVQEADEDLEITFAPAVTSTQKPVESESNVLDRRKTPSPVKRRVTVAASSNRQLDNSFDVILDKNRTTPSPNYKYRGKTVRGKARAQLQGWDCEDCQKFYEVACKNLSPSKIKAKMNMCSRHRSKYKHAKPPTPPGFWDLDIPDTPE